jgi:hypothetical protein
MQMAQEPEEVEFVLTVLERLAQRYGNHPALWGIEVLNEPITELEWKVMGMPERYPARDVEKAKGSKPIEIDFIRSFYIDAYHRLRAYLPKEKCIVFHDAFMQPFFTDENGELIEVQLWDDFMKDEQFENIVLDSHLYLFALEGLDHPKTPQEFADSVKKRYESYIKQCNFPVIVGEWCLFNPKCIELERQMAALDPQSDAYKEAEKKEMKSISPFLTVCSKPGIREPASFSGTTNCSLMAQTMKTGLAGMPGILTAAWIWAECQQPIKRKTVLKAKFQNCFFIRLYRLFRLTAPSTDYLNSRFLLSDERETILNGCVNNFV